mgnify:CR=1 FL=1
MNIQELYNDLINAFSEENLNRITANLISLYKNKNYGKIREVSNRISKYVPITEEKDAKCFSKLIMLYHPDKGEVYRKSIQDLFEINDYTQLLTYSHIFLISDIESVTEIAIGEDIDYHPEYVWDVENDDNNSDFELMLDNDSEEFYSSEFDSNEFEKSFYNLIKIREYGHVAVEFPPYYLEDFEEFEMVNRGMDSLDGIEYCLHVKILDLSENMVSDISDLWNLVNLEELYIANNQIGYIDSLSNLIELTVIDLSGNQINDISPILNLDNLKFVNLIGNPVPEAQISKLKETGVFVMEGEV